MKILLLAGEESGLLYANRLRELLPAEYRTYQDFFKTSDLAVMGFIPVLLRLFFFLRVAKTMKNLIRTWKPDVVVTIDYPGLNLKLAAFARNQGIPAVHLVCPQVWAWHHGRIPKIAASLTKLLCFFPFEPALFPRSPGFKPVFIGHPLCDLFDEDKIVGCGARDRKIVAILPGSRIGEIERIFPRLLKAIEIIKRTGDYEFVIPAANDKTLKEINRILSGEQYAGVKACVKVQKGGARDLLRRADAAAVASGTATLEAALARCPTVLVYAVSPLLAWFARRVIKGVRHIGLANIIVEKCSGENAGVEPPMPELIQEAFTPEAVAEQLITWLTDDRARENAIAALDDAMAYLHSNGNALMIAADEIKSASAKNVI